MVEHSPKTFASEEKATTTAGIFNAQSTEKITEGRSISCQITGKSIICSSRHKTRYI